MESTLAHGGISLALVFYLPEVFLSLELPLLRPLLLIAFFGVGGGGFLFTYLF